MDVHEIVLAAIENTPEAEGLVHIFNECVCSANNLAPCGKGPYPDCMLARRLVMPESGPLIDPKTGEPVHLWGDMSPGDDIFVQL